MVLSRQQRKAQMDNPVLLLATQIWTGFAGLAGILTIVGGADRWSSQIYTYLSLVPGSPHIWGVILLALTVGSFVAYHTGHPLGLRIFLRAIAVWCVLFAVGALFAALVTPTVAFTPAVWLTAAAVQFFLLATLWKEYGEVDAN